MISVSVNSNLTKLDINKLQLNKLAEFVLEKECKFSDVCASINFISSEEIHKLNKQYRGIDSATDVLSFECDSIEDGFSTDDCYDVGDIFICEDIAKANSEKFSTSLDSEIKLLVVHGMLHLCGFDHIKDDEAKIMEAKEEEILDAWGQ